MIWRRGEKVERNKPYLFEPDVNTIYNEVLPLYVLSSMQEAICSNRVSEQAARVMAMQSANDNAKELLDELQLEYNNASAEYYVRIVGYYRRKSRLKSRGLKNQALFYERNKP